MIFFYFCVFMKTVGFCTVFIADMNSACKNTLVGVYIYWISTEGTIPANFIKGYSLAIQPFFFKNLKISNFALFVFFSIYKWYFFTFCDTLLKSFSENFKQLTKMKDVLLFLCFHENCTIFSCFHRRYEFCMQKYPSKCIFIEFP